MTSGQLLHSIGQVIEHFFEMCMFISKQRACTVYLHVLDQHCRSSRGNSHKLVKSICLVSCNGHAGSPSGGGGELAADGHDGAGGGGHRDRSGQHDSDWMMATWIVFSSYMSYLSFFKECQKFQMLEHFHIAFAI